MSTKNGSKRPNVGTAKTAAKRVPAQRKPLEVVRDMSKRKAEVRAEIITALS